jgi:cell volume regulation protein A
MAYVLTIAFLSLVVNQDQGLASVIPLFIQQMLVGGLAGLGFGMLSKRIINRIHLDFEGLYPILVIALMFVTFSATDFVGGNGFLAIYICAVYLGNQDLIHKKAILKFYDGMAWLMQIVLFLTLGLLVFPTQVVPVMGIGLLISLFLIVVARPVSVFLSLMFFKMQTRRRFYISWVGLRGAVPIVFATYPLLAGIDKAPMIFNIVFFVSVTSVLIQGTTLGIVAKWLHVALPERIKPVSESEKLIIDLPKSTLQEIEILPHFQAVNKRIVDLNFPRSAFIVMIKRDEMYIRPGGSTVIQPNDTLMVLADREEDFLNVHERLHRPVGSITK